MYPKKIRNIRIQKHPDLTGIKGTAGNAMIKIIQQADTYTDIDTLKNDVMNAINNSKKISIHKKRSYRNNIAKEYSLQGMLYYVTNIFHAAANNNIDW